MGRFCSLQCTMQSHCPFSLATGHLSSGRSSHKIWFFTPWATQFTDTLPILAGHFIHQQTLLPWSWQSKGYHSYHFKTVPHESWGNGNRDGRIYVECKQSHWGQNLQQFPLWSLEAKEQHISASDQLCCTNLLEESLTCARCTWDVRVAAVDQVSFPWQIGCFVPPLWRLSALVCLSPSPDLILWPTLWMSNWAIPGCLIARTSSSSNKALFPEPQQRNKAAAMPQFNYI